MRKGIMRRFLLSYAFVLMPLLILNVWLITAMRANRAESIRNQIQLQTENARERLDSVLERYRRSAVILGNEPALFRGRMLASVQNAADGISTLRDTANYLPEVSEVFVSFGTHQVFSNRGMTGIDTYYSVSLGLDASTASEVKALVEADQIRLSRIHSPKLGSCYVFHIPTRTYRGHTIVSINFVLTEAMLLKTAQPNVPYRELTIHTRPGYALSGKSAPEVPASFAHGAGYAVSDGRFISLRVGYDQDGLLANDTNRWIMWYSISATLVGVAGILSIYFSKRQYRPIAQMVSHVKSLVSDRSFPPALNEYDYINTFMSSMVVESKSILEKLHNERRLVREQSATLIFNGLLRSRQQIRTRLELSNESMECRYFAVVTVVAAKECRFDGVERALNGFLSYQSEFGPYAALFVLIGLKDEDRGKSAREEIAARILVKSEYRACISGVFSNLEQIGQAAMETKERLICSKDESIIIVANHARAGRNSILFDSLIEAIAAHDREYAFQLLDQIRKESLNCESDLVAQEIIRAAIVTSSTMLQRESQESHRQDASSALNHIISQQHSDKWELLKAIISEVCAGRQRVSVIETATAYIDEHYADNALSLCRVADHCQVSPAYLSRLFKRKTGSGYVEYVTNLRLEEARRLLTESNLPLAEIAGKVGYVNASSLRRKFTAQMDVTMTEYRQNARSGIRNDA